MPGGRRIGLALLLAVAVFPSSADASNLGVSGTDRVSYNAAAGEVNNLQVARLGDNYVFTEVGGVPVTPALPCVNAGANVGICPVSGMHEIEVTLGDLGDTAVANATLSAALLERVTFFGGDGSDNVTGAPNVENSMAGDDGTDAVTGGLLDDDLSGGQGVDSLTGGRGDDLLRLASTDLLADVGSGGPGNDQLSANSEAPDGPDTYSGGPGLDSINLRERLDDLTVTLNGVADDGASCPGVGCEQDKVQADIEFIDLGDGDDKLTGAAGFHQIDGGPGNDTLSGGAGDDEVNGSAGDDTVRGGPGNDFVIGADGTDRIRGDAGDDYLSQSDLFDGERDVYDGGPGLDETGGGGGEFTFGIRVDLDGRADDGPLGGEFEGLRDNVLGTVEGLEGSPRDDILIGNGKANELEGGDGADRLVGKGGADGLEGGRGNDNINGGKSRDTLEGDGGADRIRSKDKSADEVSCGSSRDLVIADRRDRPGADCDRVRR